MVLRNLKVSDYSMNATNTFVVDVFNVRANLDFKYRINFKNKILEAKNFRDFERETAELCNFVTSKDP